MRMTKSKLLFLHLTRYAAIDQPLNSWFHCATLCSGSTYAFFCDGSCNGRTFHFALGIHNHTSIVLESCTEKSEIIEARRYPLQNTGKRHPSVSMLFAVE